MRFSNGAPLRSASTSLRQSSGVTGGNSASRGPLSLWFFKELIQANQMVAWQTSVHRVCTVTSWRLPFTVTNSLRPGPLKLPGAAAETGAGATAPAAAAVAGAGAETGVAA